MWYVLLFEILNAKVGFLAQFNVTKYGKTGIEYREQMTYAVGYVEHVAHVEHVLHSNTSHVVRRVRL